MPEALGKARVILLVRLRKKGIHDDGVENIGVRGTDAQIDIMVNPRARIVRNSLVTFRAFGERRERGAVERARLIFEVTGAERLVFEQFSADKSARPAVFIVNPGIHAELARFF